VSSVPSAGPQAAPVARAEVVGENDPDVPDAIRRKAMVAPAPPPEPVGDRAAPAVPTLGEVHQPLPLMPAGFPWQISPAQFVELCRGRDGKAERLFEDVWSCKLDVDEPVPIDHVSAQFCEERLCKLRLDFQFAHRVNFSLARKGLEDRYGAPESQANEREECKDFDTLQWFFVPAPSAAEWFRAGGGDIVLSAWCDYPDMRPRSAMTMSIGYQHESWYRHRVLLKQRDAQSW